MAYAVSSVDRTVPYYVNGYPTRGNMYNKILMSAIFVVLFIVSALRFDIGNDYYTYTQTAHEASVGGYVVTETGFNLLVRLVYTIAGGEYYEIVFAIFAFVTLMFFLKGMKRQSVNFFETFFLFMMIGMYFQTFNTVRYYLALSIAFYSMRYVLERDWIKFVFVIILAAFFHKSVLIVIPIYFIASFGWKKWQIAVGLIVSVACFVLKNQMLSLALMLYPSYKDTIYLSGGTSLTSIIRIFAVLVLYFWFLYYYNKKNPEFDKGESWYREIRFYGQLNMIAFVTATFFSFLPVVTRLVYYFGVSQLLIIPLIMERISDVKLRKYLKIFVGLIAIAYFMIFLRGAGRDGVGLLPYKSWLFQTTRYTFK
jgi:hypothetical protein